MVVISLVQDPWMGIRALICVLVIQMIDNWLLTPNIVGGQMGISPLLELIGLCVGGALFGFIGMIIGDVLVAVLKVVFYDTYIAWRLRKRVEAGELSAEYTISPETSSRRPTLIRRVGSAIKNIFRKREK